MRLAADWIAAMCDDVREALSAEHDGESPVLGGWELRRHLRHCQQCRRFADNVDRIDELFFRSQSGPAGSSGRRRMTVVGPGDDA